VNGTRNAVVQTEASIRGDSGITINILQEKLVPLRKAPAHYPGKRPHIATVFRHAKDGVNDTTLETCKIGQVIYTSEEALERFFAAQNAPRSPAPAVTPAQRQRQSEAARAALEAMGI